MLRPDEYAHLTADHWEAIAKKILRLKKGQQIIMFSSDEHEGGVTSFMPQVGRALEGFAGCADIWVKNGDNFEYQSPTTLTKTVKSLVRAYAAEGRTDYMPEAQKLAEKILLRKIDDDNAALEKQITEKPARRIVKIIGNHENCEPVREKLQGLEDKYPNFQWSPELELIRAPDGKKKKSDFILAFHGDLQMYDLGVVEDGHTDKQRPIYTLEKMAAKAVGIATSYWKPSAQKQEGFQKIVSWLRKPKPTAKTILAELNFAAQNAEGFKTQKNNLKEMDKELDSLYAARRMFEKQKNKFESFQKQSGAAAAKQETLQQELEANGLTIGDQIQQMDNKIAELKDKERAIQNKSHLFFTGKLDAEKRQLSYKRPGKDKIKILTPKTLERVTHMNYGHTHVPCEGIEVKGVTVSNNGSVTWAPMQSPQDDGSDAGKPPEKIPDLRNLGALLYIVEDGKVKDIISIGRLFTEKAHEVKQLVRAVPIPGTVSEKNAAQDR